MATNREPGPLTRNRAERARAARVARVHADLPPSHLRDEPRLTEGEFLLADYQVRAVDGRRPARGAGVRGSRWPLGGGVPPRAAVPDAQPRDCRNGACRVD